MHITHLHAVGRARAIITTQKNPQVNADLFSAGTKTVVFVKQVARISADNQQADFAQKAGNFLRPLIIPM